MKTLADHDLDLRVALAVGLGPRHPRIEDGHCVMDQPPGDVDPLFRNAVVPFNPSSNGACAMALVERFNLSLIPQPHPLSVGQHGHGWVVFGYVGGWSGRQYLGQGTTPCLAICDALVNKGR